MQTGCLIHSPLQSVTNSTSYMYFIVLLYRSVLGVRLWTNSIIYIVLPARIEVYKLISVQYKRYATEHAHGVDGTVRDRAEPTVDSQVYISSTTRCWSACSGSRVRFFSSCACRPIAIP